MSKILQVAVGVIKNAAGDILISLRDPALHQGGLWEFPGGKIEAGETPRLALSRELNEELGIQVVAATPLIKLKHNYPDRHVELHVFWVGQFTGDAISTTGQACLWVSPPNLANYAFPAANRAIITAAQLPPFYAILDDAELPTLLANFRQLLAHGNKLIQLRLKNRSYPEVEHFLTVARPLARDYQAKLLINSGVSHAAQFKLDGLHLSSTHLLALSQRPAPPSGIAERDYWLAASCHNADELAHAQAIGVDFAVLAPVQATLTHPDATPLGWERFRQLVADATLPVYALGGLNRDDLATAQQAGGQGIAAIRAFLTPPKTCVQPQKPRV